MIRPSIVIAASSSLAKVHLLQLRVVYEVLVAESLHFLCQVLATVLDHQLVLQLQVLDLQNFADLAVLLV